MIVVVFDDDDDPADDDEWPCKFRELAGDDACPVITTDCLLSICQNNSN